jgi:hypothetical protein
MWRWADMLMWAFDHFTWKLLTIRSNNNPVLTPTHHASRVYLTCWHWIWPQKVAKILVSLSCPAH